MLPWWTNLSVEYKKNNSDDIISYMLTLFEQESFIKEVQSILGEQLLRTEDGELHREVSIDPPKRVVMLTDGSRSDW